MRKYDYQIQQSSRSLEQRANNLLRKQGRKKKKRTKKVKQRKYPTKYAEYIKSHFWTERKERYFRNHKKECQACLSKKNICLHHMHYGCYGKEPDEWLVALCKECHEEFHTNYPLSANMIKDTNDFIILKRELFDFPVWV